MTDESSESRVISKHEFFFETPLYEPVKEEQLEEEYHTGDVDAYSAINNIDTTYTIVHHHLGDNSPWLDNFHSYKLKCKRKDNDLLVFFTYEVDDSVVKIGQAPSLATLQFSEIGKKYKKQLGREDLKLYKKAIGLAAHGVGAGSFVYLRRIFEKLILGTYNENKDNLDMSAEDFKSKRMTEKVEALKNYLPTQLVEMKEVYSILSSGVHELSEQECLSYFPALKLSIELVLDQQIENDNKIARDKAARKQIQNITKKLSDSKENRA